MTSGQPPTRLVLTHGHADHAAAAQKMVDTWGLPVAAGRAEIPFILGPTPYRRIEPSWWGYRLFQLSGPSLIGRNVQLPLDEGMIVDGLEVFHVPGHAPGMVALLHRADRALICGDTFANVNDKLTDRLNLQEKCAGALSRRSVLYWLLLGAKAMHFTIETEREEDGRWLAEVMELPGALAYGETEQEAIARAEALGLRVLAEQIEHGELAPTPLQIQSPFRPSPPNPLSRRALFTPGEGGSLFAAAALSPTPVRAVCEREWRRG